MKTKIQVLAMLTIVSLVSISAVGHAKEVSVDATTRLAKVRIEFPDGSVKAIAISVGNGMTVEDAMKRASGIEPKFKWKATWFESIWSYQIVEIDKITNANPKYWQYCIGAAGFEAPATRGINLMGLSPGDNIFWKLEEFGKLKCP